MEIDSQPVEGNDFFLDNIVDFPDIFRSQSISFDLIFKHSLKNL